MILIRFIQRASILAGMTSASLSFYSTSVHADMPQICVIASNGKTACGTLKAAERACVTTDGGNSICGKFTSAREGQETINPSQGLVAREEVDNFMYTLKGCGKSNTTVKCELSIVNKGRERGIYIDNTSNFIDTNGKSNQSYSREIGGVNTGNMTLTPGIDYSASITFKNISEQVMKAQVLNIITNYGKVYFRNVSF